MATMNSLTDIWSVVMDSLSQELTQTAINTWFSDCTPIEINNNTLIVHTTSDFKRSIIQSRFEKTICAVLYDLFSCPFELVVLAGDDELLEYREKRPSSEEMPEMDGYTFDRFIVGPSNKFAHAAAIAVSQNPGKAYNPLLIYGNSGLGKTHLLLAIGQTIRHNNPSAKIAYVKGDDFTNELIASIREGKNAEFREKYRQSTLLLVDDIQFIAGKKQTQEEFFHTFNTLYESGRQIVLTSDRPPREMTQLEDRLQTRFEWGLMVDVAPPDFETRLAIIKNKAALLGVQLPDDISSFIAENLTANVRQIEGALNKLLAYRDLLGNQVDGEAVSRAVKDMLKKYNEFVPSPSLIIEYICRYYDVDEEQVRGQGRKRDLMEARQTAMYLIRRMTNLSLNDIGKEFGDRDHTTVLHSLDQVEKKMRSDPAYAEKVKEITTNINNKK
mgnify:CR=1 FL=1